MRLRIGYHFFDWQLTFFIFFLSSSCPPIVRRLGGSFWRYPNTASEVHPINIEMSSGVYLAACSPEAHPIRLQWELKFFSGYPRSFAVSLSILLTILRCSTFRPSFHLLKKGSSCPILENFAKVTIQSIKVFFGEDGHWWSLRNTKCLVLPSGWFFCDRSNRWMRSTEDGCIPCRVEVVSLG